MQEDLASLVHSLIHRGLILKERLDRGEAVPFMAEQAILKSLLLNDVEAKRWADFGGEGRSSESNNHGLPGSDPHRALLGPYLGTRYALVCWLDELFTVDSPWELQWNEHKLETALYGTNDRAWMFWEQARLASLRPGSDALEVFFLCVMLGFRGDFRQDPAQLQAWVAAARSHLGRSQPREWSPPPVLEPLTFVPPLRGREKMHRMILAGGLLMLVLMPVVAFFVVRQLAP